MTDKLPRAIFPSGAKYATENRESPKKVHDPVNHPAHYTKGTYEVIDVIEDAVQFAPDVTLGGLQWQVLKYVLRIWHKHNALEDARKARFYLNRLISKLEVL